MKRTRLLLISAIAVLPATVAVLAATLHSSAVMTTSETTQAPVDVQVVTATMADIGQLFEIGGDVRARDTAAITSRILAQVKEVRVKAGDRVKAGQTLVVLDARDLQAGRARAEAGLTAAEQAARLAVAERQAADASLTLASLTFKRIAELRQKNSATPSEFDQAQAGLKAAEARVASAEAQVAQSQAAIREAQAAGQSANVAASFATLVAPFDGTITQKLVDPGNMASPGLPLVTMEDARSFRLEVRVDESRARSVQVGQPVDVVFDSGVASGRVSEISPLLDNGTHAFLAKIDLPTVQGLRSGMFGKARFQGPSHAAICVPEGAILRRGQLTSVFVVDKTNTARLRLLSIGEPAGGRVEVRAGLDAGETVVARPGLTLTDGSRVRVHPAAAESYR